MKQQTEERSGLVGSISYVLVRHLCELDLSHNVPLGLQYLLPPGPKPLASKSTVIYALGMTILEVCVPQKALEPFGDVPGRCWQEHGRTISITKDVTVMLVVIEGRKPDRPPSGFQITYGTFY